MTVILASFVIRGVYAIEENTNSAAYDQRSYLGLGLNLREGRDLTDGKRHPLLPALLAPIAERDWPYYTRAKFLSLGLGVAGLGATYLLGRRWFSARVGLVAAGLLSLSPPFLHFSSHVMAETLLLVVSLAAWYLMAQALAAPEPLRWRYALGAGLAAGLAYLTKATALQMVPAFLLVALWRYRQRLWRRKEIYLFLAAWLLVCSPLLTFNLREYGNPLYNYNYRHEIFLENPAERHIADLDEAPTWQTFVREHAVTDMAARLWAGLKEVTRVLVVTLAPVRSEALTGAAQSVWIIAWLLLFVFLASRWRTLAADDERASVYLLLVVMLVGSLIPLGWWFAQASSLGPRFVFVYQPMIYIVALGSLGVLARSAEGWLARRMSRLTLALDVLAAACLVIPALSSAAQTWPQLRPHPVAVDREANARGQAALAWLEEGTPYGTRVLWGPSYTLPNWIYERRLSLKDVPSKIDTWESLNAYAQEERLAYAILDWEMVGRRQDAFSPYFTSDYPYVAIEALPGGWALCYFRDGLPANWAIFRLLEAVPPEAQLDVSVGDEIHLVGSELEPEEAAPGGSVHVTLYWRALSAMERNYSVFVHALDPEGRLVAQSDSWPLANRYPTTRWRAGDLLGDRHTLALPADLALGTELKLYVGMYDLDTMERLPAIMAGGERPDKDAVPLPYRLVVSVSPSN
ncbi:MAG: glycosyltransferase family 39 protein [Anaerolineae bacterium]|nr:glycosyltransferase family 39 protein [Anaerolineae bacterium]